MSSPRLRLFRDPYLYWLIPCVILDLSLLLPVGILWGNILSGTRFDPWSGSVDASIYGLGSQFEAIPVVAALVISFGSYRAGHRRLALMTLLIVFSLGALLYFGTPLMKIQPDG